MQEPVIIGDATLYCGDCLEILPTLGKVDAVVTDPPYGMNLDTDNSRFCGGQHGNIAKRGNGVGSAYGKPLIGDDKPFDPKPFLNYPEVILWGYNHFASKLPVGTTLIWIKRFDNAFETFLSDAEIAWKKGGHGVFCRRDLSNNAIANERVHPTQKPVGIMKWCIEKTKGDTILDPFMGSGTTGVAALKLGRKFIGCEIDPTYFKIACDRIAKEANQLKLF